MVTQFVGNLPTNCLNVFDHFVGLVLKGLKVTESIGEHIRACAKLYWDTGNLLFFVTRKAAFFISYFDNLLLKCYIKLYLRKHRYIINMYAYTDSFIKQF